MSANSGKKLDLYLEKAQNVLGNKFFDTLAKFTEIQHPVEEIQYELSWTLCNIAATSSEIVLNTVTNYSTTNVSGEKVYIFVSYMSNLLLSPLGRLQSHGLRFFANLLEN